MMNDLIKELRNEAQECRIYNEASESAGLLDRAADTIEMLQRLTARPQDDDIRKLVDALKGDTSCDGCRHYKPEDEAFPFWECDGCYRLYADYEDLYEAAE